MFRAKPASVLLTRFDSVHGGGWTIGDLDSEDATCRFLCTETKSVVVSIDYRK